MSTATVERPTAAAKALRLCILGVAALVVLKFLAILAGESWDLGQSPFMLLVVVALPVALIVALSFSRPRAAAGLALPLLLVLVVVVVLALVRDGLVRESWADYPFAYGGLVLAAWGVAAAVRLLRRR